VTQTSTSHSLLQGHGAGALEIGLLVGTMLQTKR